MRLSNRLPLDYFVTKGSGQSDITIHAGSYHLALRDAGIESANIMQYSSILPAAAREIPREDYEITHGEVMETIMAVATCMQGETATAGLIFGFLENSAGERVGGLVCETGGVSSPSDTTAHLRDMLGELHENGYEEHTLVDVRVLTQTVTPTKRYGTALVAICFTSFDQEVQQ